MAADTIPSCDICYDAFDRNHPPIRLKCLHVFHKNPCIEEWFKKSNTCPSCRQYADQSDVKLDFVLLTLLEGIQINGSVANAQVMNVNVNVSAIDNPLPPPIASNQGTGVSWPFHSHLLYLTNTKTLYPEYNGNYKCDGCATDQPRGFAYHCSTCRYNVCQKCFHQRGSQPPVNPPVITNTPVIVFHPDPIINNYPPPPEPIYIPPPVPISPQSNAYWSSYHSHPLYLSDARVTYPSSNGNWICDYCRKQGNATMVMYHCNSCNYDLCDNCVHCPSSLPQNALWSSYHAHPVYLSDPRVTYPSNGNWRCGHCRKKGSKTAIMYHCGQCQFDLCDKCIHRTNPRTNKVCK